jgi:hypothetical protein
MRTSESISAIAAALAKTQAELRPAVKDAVNPAFRSKYADLSSVLEACRNALPQNGLSVVQDVTTDIDRGAIGVATRILHSSGEWIECGPIFVPLSKQDAHGVGSATSYGKRYGLCAAVGIAVADEDDDGAVASHQKPATRKPATASVDAGQPSTSPEPPEDPRLVSRDQLKRLWAMAQKKGWTKESLHAWLITMGYPSSKDIRKTHYEDVCASVEEGPPADLSALMTKAATLQADMAAMHGETH